jgi:hypothetical protein
MTRNILFIAALPTVLLLFATESQAQQSSTYQPSRPTLSPYLYLTRPNSGPFPNYQAFVQPTKNQQQFNQAQQTQVTELQSQVQQQQQQMGQQKYGPAVMAPTGVGGGAYNSLSHYYPSGGSASTGARGKSAARR